MPASQNATSSRGHFGSRHVKSFTTLLPLLHQLSGVGRAGGPLTCLVLLRTQSLSPPVTHLALSPVAPLLGHARPRGVFSGRGRPPATRLSSAAQHEAGRLDVRVAIASCIGVRGYFGLSWIGATFDGSPLPSRLRIRPLVCMRRTFVGEKAQIKTSMHDPTNTNLSDWLCPLIALDPDP